MTGNCPYADGFTIWEKFFAQIMFNLFCLTGFAAIAIEVGAGLFPMPYCISAAYRSSSCATWLARAAPICGCSKTVCGCRYSSPSCW